MNLNLPDIYNAATTFVDDNIKEGRGAKVAIYYQDQKITYEEVHAKVNRTGNALKNLGIEIENRVLVILPDSPEFAYTFFGARPCPGSSNVWRPICTKTGTMQRSTCGTASPAFTKRTQSESFPGSTGQLSRPGAVVTTSRPLG
jgi:hypothetical protein